MMQVYRYTPDKATEWNEFIRTSKNGTFLLEREYMDYHRDRFKDHSLMFYNDNNHLIAIMPANESGDALWSHQGLTYGGLILSKDVYGAEVGKIFKVLHNYIHTNNFRELHYKAIPDIYHSIPAEEDEYWLWRYDTKMDSCYLSTTVNLKADTLPQSKRKRTYHSKLEREGYTVCRQGALSAFWPILRTNLKENHQVAPVHTLEEMQRLMTAFPDNIKCWTVLSPEGDVVGGTILYVTDEVIHTQYISASPKGKQCHALDFLFVSAIDYFRSQGQQHYFDFGNSNEQGGRYLNESLLIQKELFGGRGVVYKHYCWNV